MTDWTPVPAHALVAAPWKNGLGTSREIASAAGPGGGFGWTIGVADLEERDAAFSYYPHADRIFTPIGGDPPPLLAFEGGPFEPCPLLVPKRFPGDIPTLSRIPAPGQAFNVLVDRRYFTADVEILHLTPGEVALPHAPVVLLHCLAGRISAASDQVAAGDSLRGSGGIVTATEGSVAIVARIHPIV